MFNFFFTRQEFGRFLQFLHLWDKYLVSRVAYNTHKLFQGCPLVSYEASVLVLKTKVWGILKRVRKFVVRKKEVLIIWLGWVMFVLYLVLLQWVFLYDDVVKTQGELGEWNNPFRNSNKTLYNGVSEFLFSSFMLPKWLNTVPCKVLKQRARWVHRHHEQREGAKRSISPYMTQHMERSWKIPPPPSSHPLLATKQLCEKQALKLW